MRIISARWVYRDNRPVVAVRCVDEHGRGLVIFSATMFSDDIERAIQTQPHP